MATQDRNLGFSKSYFVGCWGVKTAALGMVVGGDAINNGASFITVIEWPVLVRSI